MKIRMLDEWELELKSCPIDKNGTFWEGAIGIGVPYTQEMIIKYGGKTLDPKEVFYAWPLRKLETSWMFEIIKNKSPDGLSLEEVDDEGFSPTASFHEWNELDITASDEEDDEDDEEEALKNFEKSIRKLYKPVNDTVPRKLKVDMVNEPPHYKGKGIEVIDVIEGFGLGFHLGNVVKYVLRAGKKENELEDLKKAQWYLNRKIEQLSPKKDYKEI